MYLYSYKYFSENYVKLPKAESPSKIIVSLSYSGTNINSIKPSINSLLDQTVHPDQIIISINTTNHPYTIVPAFLTEANIIILHNLSKNYKECSNFISPLLRERDADTKIILVNDKQVYGIDFIETLVEASNKHPNKAIYIKGYNAKKLVTQSTFEGPDNVIDIRYGALIKPSFFSGEFIDTLHTPLDAPNAVLSSELLKNKVELHHLKYKDNFVNKMSPTQVKAEKMGIVFYALYFDL